jgi:hypothetical protein
MQRNNCLSNHVNLLCRFAVQQLSKCAPDLCAPFTRPGAAKTGAAVALMVLGLGTRPSVAAAQAPFDPNAYYSLICKDSNMALDNGGVSGSSAAGAQVHQWPWNASGTNQAWKITGAPDNLTSGPYYYNLLCETSSMALASWGSTTAGQSLLQYWPWWLCGGAPMPTENWLIQPAANAPSYYNLTCKQNGMALDNRGSKTAGDYVIQWPLLTGSRNQVWEPDQQWEPEPMYSWVAITFTTGGDDLRGNVSNIFGGHADSWVDVTVTVNGVAQSFNDVSQDQNWGNGSVHTVYLQLDTPISYITSGDVQVSMPQWWNGYNSDTWDLQGLNVALYSADPDPNASNNYAGMVRHGYLEASKLAYGGSGSSTWRQFTASNSTYDFVFQYMGR